jgi:hypothetical protein
MNEIEARRDRLGITEHIVKQRTRNDRRVHPRVRLRD